RLDARLDGLALLLLEAGEEGIGGAEVGQDDLAGFSVDAPGGDDLEVLVAVDDLGGERRHVLVNTTAGRSMSRGSVRFLLSHYGYGRGYYSKAGARRSPLNLVTTHFDLSRNANRRRSDRKRSAKNTVNASFSEEPEEREGCDASGRTDIHPANPESQARVQIESAPVFGLCLGPLPASLQDVCQQGVCFGDRRIKLQGFPGSAHLLLACLGRRSADKNGPETVISVRQADISGGKCWILLAGALEVEHALFKFSFGVVLVEAAFEIALVHVR